MQQFYTRRQTQNGFLQLNSRLELYEKIILHWTAGSYYPTACEKNCYHFLVDKDGKTHSGNYKPEANLNCNDGEYAAHTGGGNTGAIGVAICAMAGFKSKSYIGNYPITAKQFEAAMKLCAELSLKYNIPVSAETIMTHYEFGIKHPSTTSAGKIDIIYIPPYPWVEKMMPALLSGQKSNGTG